MVHTAKNLQSVSKPERITVQDVLDVLGKRVYHQSVQFTANTASIQVGNLPPGVYLLQLTDEKAKVSDFKFVIQ